MSAQKDIGLLVEAVEARSLNYLRDEMDLAVDKVEHTPQSVKSLTLRNLTSLVSVGGNLGVYIAFSFDLGVIRRIFQAYTADIDIAEDEELIYMEETAGDVINTVIGNALAAMPRESGVISLTPPVVLSQARSITRHKDAYFYMTDLITALGAISIMFIGPRQLFDENLEYRKA